MHAIYNPTSDLRKENGHGSSPLNPSHVTLTNGAGAIQFQYDSDEVLSVPVKRIVYATESVTIDGLFIIDGIYKEQAQCCN
jgi:hypothetical protein